MTDSEFLRSVRKRTHDLANACQRYEVQFAKADARLTQLESKMKEVSELRETAQRMNDAVTRLHHDSRVLRWVLGVVTMIAVGILVKLV